MSTSLLERVKYIEKPDIIINSIGEKNNTAKISFETLLTLHDVFPDTRIIQLVDSIPDLENKYFNQYNETLAYWDFVEKLTILKHGTVLRIPKVFGARDKNGRFIEILRFIFENKALPKLSGRVYPWVYAEDVASRIWYLIENDSNNYNRMPALGNVSDYGIAQIIDEVFELNLTDGRFTESEPENSEDDWVPDSKNIKDAMIKTINWYKINNWAL